MTRINSLYGSQTSPVVLSMQNNVINIRVYGSQPSSVDFACKTVTFGRELQVCMGPSPHLWFLHAKQRLLDQNYKSLWVPALICGFCMQNSDFRTRITSLYGSQTSPMVFCIQNGDFSTRIASLYWSQTSPMVFCIQNCAFSSRIASLYGSQPSSVVLCIHNSDIMTRINSLYGSQTSPVVLNMHNHVINIRITSVYGSQPSSVDFACKTATFGPELQVSMGPSPHLWFLHAKQRILDQNYKSL